MDWYQKWKDVVAMCQRQEGEIRNLQASRDPPCGQTPCLVDSASPSPTSSFSSLSRACFEHMVTGRPWFPQKLLNRQQGEMDGDFDSLGGGGGSLKSSGAGGGGKRRGWCLVDIRGRLRIHAPIRQGPRRYHIAYATTCFCLVREDLQIPRQTQTEMKPHLLLPILS